MKQVVCVLLINNNGECCLSERLQTSHSGYWQAAGGLVDEGEVPDEAAARELLEETGLQVSLTKIIQAEDKGLAGDTHTFHGYLGLVGSEQPQRTEPEKHGPWIWLDPSAPGVKLLPVSAKVINSYLESMLSENAKK